MSTTGHTDSELTRHMMERHDARDFAAMQACRRDSDLLQTGATGLSETVATRVHHGFLAFRVLA